ncbi:MAG: hypothetical protein ACO3XO_04925 [Bdellovibrionota bacterium]|jgi:hypothetical protein
MAASKPNYLTKTVDFNDSKLTLYSLDGATWSSRKDELQVIKTRYEESRVTFQEIRSGVINKKAIASKQEQPEQ